MEPFRHDKQESSSTKRAMGWKGVWFLFSSQIEISILRKMSGTEERFTSENSLLGFKEEHEPLSLEKREIMNQCWHKREQQEICDHRQHI